MVDIRELEQALEESLKLTEKSFEMQEIEAQMLDLATKEVFIIKIHENHEIFRKTRKK